jgi:hypothetical protein
MAEIKQYLKALRTHRLSRKTDYAGCPCNAHKCDQYKNIHLSEWVTAEITKTQKHIKFYTAQTKSGCGKQKHKKHKNEKKTLSNRFFVFFVFLNPTTVFVDFYVFLCFLDKGLEPSVKKTFFYATVFIRICVFL